ncbi:hypothetical protein DENSPDRAFT_894552 [Dentipellis sp. KUC8613]|nr:hypothetical protein DENSPDRAFT_894552 [Dentipellis sp. KUC8613]
MRGENANEDIVFDKLVIDLDAYCDTHGLNNNSDVTFSKIVIDLDAYCHAHSLDDLGDKVVIDLDAYCQAHGLDDNDKDVVIDKVVIDLDIYCKANGIKTRHLATAPEVSPMRVGGSGGLHTTEGTGLQGEVNGQGHQAQGNNVHPEKQPTRSTKRAKRARIPCAVPIPSSVRRTFRGNRTRHSTCEPTSAFATCPPGSACISTFRSKLVRAASFPPDASAIIIRCVIATGTSSSQPVDPCVDVREPSGHFFPPAASAIIIRCVIAIRMSSSQPADPQPDADHDVRNVKRSRRSSLTARAPSSSSAA